MADRAGIANGQRIQIHPSIARQLKDEQLEFCVGPDGRISLRKKAPPVPSLLHTAAYSIAAYIVIAILAAYLLVQAMEAISFLLNHSTGIATQVLWIVFLTICGLFPTSLWGWDAEDEGIEPPPLARHAGWRMHL